METEVETITIPINDYHEVIIYKYKGTNGEYYTLNGINYDINFPVEWILHKPKDYPSFITFGPNECKLCIKNGYYKGVFIGYCKFCARFANYERGNGFIGNGEELSDKSVNDKNSAWNLYLQAVELKNIGDNKLEEEYVLNMTNNGNNDEKNINRVNAIDLMDD